jgi:type II secretory pathway component PulM
MKEWYLQLATRERYVLSIGVILALGILYWGLLWRPLSVGAADARAAVAEHQMLLADLRRARGILRPALDNGAVPSQSLVVLVDRTHREQGLAGALSRNQPDGPDGIQVTLQDAAFDALMGWLSSLQQHGIAVESASINGTRTPGLVSATLVLRRT